MAAKRLQRELVMLGKSSPEFIRVAAKEDDLLTFHFVIEGPKDSPFAGGYYHGLLKFPAEYPMKPPAVMVLTPNGRFSVNTRICLSMSDYHPESWNPVWTADKILVGLLSFMLESTHTVGSIQPATSDESKRRYAAESLGYNVRNAEFAALFPDLVTLHAERAAAAAAAGGAGGAAEAAGDAAGAAAKGGSSPLWLVLYAAAALVFAAWVLNFLDPEGAKGAGL